MNACLYSIARKCLFQMDPETAHEVTLAGLRIAEKLGALSWIMSEPLRDPVTVMGLEFPNAVGLAAGMDKEANTIDAFARVGFGFVEVGTLTPKGQPGNEKPRLFRLIPEHGVINRMGFNNSGIVSGVEHIRHQRDKRAVSTIVGVNIGKNKVTPNELAIQDYVTCLREAWDVADYITVNLSSPNTPGLRALQEASTAERLIATLKMEQEALHKESGRYVPIALKVAPDLSDDEIAALSRVFLEEGLDGLVATNTTLSRAGVEANPKHQEVGGLSGAPLTKRATEVISAFYSHLGEKIPIIGVGGIMNGEDAVEKMKAGAKLIQLYTGFIYRGPALVRECVEAISAFKGEK